MQVATLFREATSLLDAGMEEGAHLKMAFQENNGIKTEPNVDDGYKTANSNELDASKHQNQQSARNHSHHISNLHHNLDSSMALVPGMANRIKDMPIMKYELPDDPYSFVDDDHIMSPVQCTPMLHQVPKKRGRKKKLKPEELAIQNSLGYQGIMSCLPNRMKDSNGMKIVKERKKHDRFNGMPEHEVSKRTLPDHLIQNLDIVIIGINPGLFAAYKGHHYAGPGNHFWKCLYLSGLTPEPMTADDDYKLLKVGIGFTNMVERATKGSADLTRKEIKEGSQILLEKLRKFKPKIAVFNGKLIFEVFSGKKDFSFGRQPEMVDGTDTYMWVMPSSSARCAQLPRAADKVPFYAALKKFRDYLNGIISEIDEKEMVFSFSKLKNFFEPDIKEEMDDGGCRYDHDGPTLNSVKKEDEVPKKKRGRPKKIKIEGDGDQKMDGISSKLREFDEKSGLPKKKRGRPKKIKTEEIDPHALPSSVMPSQAQNLSELSNPPSSNCFSPPIQSPSMHHSFSMYHQSLYNNAQATRSPLGNSQSYHQSHGYNQSPQPPSFTHSDLSSEISAAISSEHNPESPTLGPPDFEPPGQMGEEGSNKSGPEEKEDECHFSSPQSKKSYQNYDDFSTDSDSGVRYNVSQKSSMPQDLTSKSLSGLESLVDQIPSITDGDPPHSVVSGESEPIGSQYSDDSAYMSDYAARSHYSPQYSHGATSVAAAKTSNPYLLQQHQQHTNFSVSSLANSSATPESNFSVSSLAGTYAQAYHQNLMGPPPLSSDASPFFGACRAGGIDSSSPMAPIGPSPTSIGPYPYPPQYHPPPPHPVSYPNSAAVFYPAPTPSHNIHMPSPNYPYASYPQPSYLPNHMFDRFKPDHRMDFGGF